MESPARVLFRELVDGMSPLRLEGDPGVDVRSITHDSRDVAPGACFACIRGEHDDGHDHAAEAMAAGAVALLVERPLGLGIPEARVPDVRRALGPIAARLAGHPSRAMRCIGVTGTNGKTTTTYLLHAIASVTDRRAGLVGTTGARIGDRVVPLSFTTPEAPQLQSLLATMRDQGVHTVAMEVSSHALAQHRVDGTWFAAVCFTNLSHDHLDYHRSMSAYFEAKASIFTPQRCGAAVTNVDDPYGREIARRARRDGIPTSTYAWSDTTADMGVEDPRPGPEGTALVLVDRRAGERREAQVRLLGPVNVANALAAAATARTMGASLDDVARGLASVSVVPGRLERVDAGQPFTVLVDYAHTPDALVHAVAAARALAGGHRVGVVFGCGGDRDHDKRGPMGGAGAGADLVVVTSDNPRSEDPSTIAAAVAAGARAAGADPIVELDRRSAIATAIRWARRGDVVLLAGKGHETGQTAGGATRPFDDRVVARALVEELSCG